MPHNRHLNPRGRPPKPWTIDGKLYPTTTLAARALGVSPTTLEDRFKRLGTRHLTSDDLIDRRKMPIKIRGVLYPTKKAAAEALGISQWSLYRALEEGREDTVGLAPKPRDEKSS